MSILIIMKHFHGHIYFELKDIELAQILMKSAFEVGIFDIIKFFEKSVGPHPMSMIEVQFKEPDYLKVVEWLSLNRGIFSVLVHQDTGDDLKDHTENILWLGTELVLDFSFFEVIKEHPKLRIH